MNNQNKNKICIPNEFKEPLKPDDWPINVKEEILDNIFNKTVEFIKNKKLNDYILVLDLVNLSQKNGYLNGSYRITEYEIWLINLIYIYGEMINSKPIIMFVYRHLSRLIDIEKMTAIIGFKPKFLITDLIPKLYFGLKCFAICYRNSKFNKTGFCDELLKMLNDLKQFTINHPNTADSITRQSLNFLRNVSLSWFDFGCFDSNSVKKILNVENALISISKQDIEKVHGLHSTILLTIVNWVFKLRCKCLIPNHIVKYTNNKLNSNQFWIRPIGQLNDTHEGKIIKKLFAKRDWLTDKWSKEVNIDGLPSNDYFFISSFSEKINDKLMIKNYGPNQYGFTNIEKLSVISSPIFKTAQSKVMDCIWPYSSNTLFYNVIYSQKEAKSEIALLVSFINCFNFNDDRKKKLLCDSLQYLLFSYKTSDWSYEREWRFVFEMQYDVTEYINVFSKDKCFLKLESNAFLYPDFCFINDAEVISKIKTAKVKKMDAISLQNYVLCDDCMNDIEYDLSYVGNCPICGKQIEIKK